MAKRKSLRKSEEKAARVEAKVKDRQHNMPLNRFLVNGLAIFLSVLLVVALTLYVLKKIPARGFWSLAILLSIIAFFVLPWMRRKFT